MHPERTLIMVKPDGIKQGLVGAIIQRFEDRGFKLVAIKQVQASQARFEEHYRELVEEQFFSGLVKYMSSGPVVSMVWERVDAVKIGRAMIGSTVPGKSAPGTIRGDYSSPLIAGQHGHGNIIHGSDSVEAASREIDLWFSQEELYCTENCINTSANLKIK